MDFGENHERPALIDQQQEHRASELLTSSRLMKPLLIGIVVLTGLLALSDFKQLILIFSDLSLGYLLVAIVATALSYLFITLSYRELFRMIGILLRFWDLFTVSVMSTLINYFIASGGASGYALRAILFQKRGVPGTVTFSVSLLQGVLTNMGIFLLFMISFVGFLLQRSLTAIQLYILILPMVFLVIFVLFILLVIFNRKSTERVILFIRRILIWIERKRGITDNRWADGFQRMNEQFYEASALFRARRRKIWLPFMEVLYDWVFSMICLGLCFAAVRMPLPWTVVATVYFVGIFISFVFVATGGLGVMEGGMAAAFTFFQVPWESALAGVLLYRFVYYFLPLLTMLPAYFLYVRSPDMPLHSFSPKLKETD